MIPLDLRLHGGKISFAETAGAALSVTGLAMLDESLIARMVKMAEGC